MNPKNILIIEEDRDIASMLVFALKSLDLSVYTARDGAEGLTRLHELHPAIVIMDLNLSFVRGEELLKVIRTEPQLLHSIVILGTIYGQNQIAKVRDQVDFTFQKPYRLQDLRDTVKRVLCLV